MIYGYCRVSTQSQNIERQVRNILAAFPDATIVREVYTGTTFQGRDKLEKLLKKVRRDDTIVFDSVSRMSRSAEEGFALYESLYSKGIHLVFLKEPHINTDTYRKALAAKVELTAFRQEHLVTLNAVVMDEETVSTAVAPFEIRVKGEAKAVKLLPGETPIPFEVKNGETVFTTQTLHIFDMYAVEF